MSTHRTAPPALLISLAIALGSCAAGEASADLTPPSPPPPKPRPQVCFSPADCHGMLPQLCRRCPGGDLGCAHWICEDGVCKIAYCARSEDIE
jgi:hypothetical protein